jgi:hypothetical protein
MCVLVVGDGSYHRSSVCRLPNVSANSAHVETGERLETMLGLGGAFVGSVGWPPEFDTNLDSR